MNYFTVGENTEQGECISCVYKIGVNKWLAFVQQGSWSLHLLRSRYSNRTVTHSNNKFTNRTYCLIINNHLPPASVITPLGERKEAMQY